MNQPSFKPLVENWCQSVCELVAVDFEWNIQQLLFLESSEKWIYPFTSSNFSAKDKADYQWSLSLRDEGSSIKIYLNLYSHIAGAVCRAGPIRVQFAILNKTREQLLPHVHVLPINTPVSNNIVYSLSKQSMLHSGGLQTDKSMTIYCKVETLIYKGTESGVNAKSFCDQAFSDGDQLLRTLMEELFESRMLSDVTFDVDDRHFEAHKNILASRSKVFAAMFAHETKEKLSNHVKVEDIEPDVFQEFLRFIYTGRLPLETMDKMATELLAAAEKYLLDQLKIECENHLLHRMTPDNCLDLLLLTSQKHPASHLTKGAVDYFRRFPNKVMATDGWKQAKQDNLAWLCDMLQTVLTTAG